MECRVKELAKYRYERAEEQIENAEKFIGYVKDFITKHIEI